MTVEMHQQPGDRSCTDEAIGGDHWGPINVRQAFDYSWTTRLMIVLVDLLGESIGRYDCCRLLRILVQDRRNGSPIE